MFTLRGATASTLHPIDSYSSSGTSISSIFRSRRYFINDTGSNLEYTRYRLWSMGLRLLIRCKQSLGPFQCGIGTLITSWTWSDNKCFNCFIPSKFVRYPSPTAIVFSSIHTTSPPSRVPGVFILPSIGTLIDLKNFSISLAVSYTHLTLPTIYSV